MDARVFPAGAAQGVEVLCPQVRRVDLPLAPVLAEGEGREDAEVLERLNLEPQRGVHLAVLVGQPALARALVTFGELGILRRVHLDRLVQKQQVPALDVEHQRRHLLLPDGLEGAGYGEEGVARLWGKAAHTGYVQVARLGTEEVV